LKQVQNIADTEKASDDRELAKLFITNLDSYLKLVEERREAENETTSHPLLFLRHGLKDLLDQLG
jgi:hypothetical protein